MVELEKQRVSYYSKNRITSLQQPSNLERQFTEDALLESWGDRRDILFPRKNSPVPQPRINIIGFHRSLFMDRKLLIRIHLYLAAFFAPAVLLVAISGGLYLAGVKGNVKQETIYSSSEAKIDNKSTTLQADVSALLASAGVESYSFEYVKVSGATLYTRPTSSAHYRIKSNADGVEVILARPSLQSRMIELHKGHGPSSFKTFQKAFAIGLIFIMVSGLWMGIAAARLRRSTLLTVAAGAVIFALLVI
ncbi:MAG: hypothetical protein ACI97A_002662 [Planctomycetota bacterium]|jgi:hypothetical protein